LEGAWFCNLPPFDAVVNVINFTSAFPLHLYGYGVTVLALALSYLLRSVVSALANQFTSQSRLILKKLILSYADFMIKREDSLP
jgi:hypothetical protein